MDEFFIECGLTLEDFNTITAAAKLLAESGARHSLLFVFGNQIYNHCKSNDIDVREVFQDIVDDVQARLSAPRTPEEFNERYGDDDDGGSVLE